MGNTLQSYFEKYRYSLKGPLGILYISDPIGWNEDNKVFKRSNDVHGVFTNLSSNLEFYKGDEDNNGGYNYLREIYDVYGVNAVVLLIKEEDVSGVWEEVYRGFFDFSKYNRDAEKISIMFNESGLYEKIKARKSEDLELARLTTMDGALLEPLKTDLVAFEGRTISMNSKLVRTEGDGIPQDYRDNIIITNRKDTSEIRTGFYNDAAKIVAVPITMIAENDGDVQTIYDHVVPYSYVYRAVDNNGFTGYVPSNDVNYARGTTGIMFYADAKDNVGINVDFDIEFARVYDAPMKKLRLELVKYKDGVLYNYKSHEILVELDNPDEDQFYSYNASKVNISLEIGESLCLSFRIVPQSHVFTTLAVKKANVTILDETFHEPSQAKVILPFEAIDRIVEVVSSSKNSVISNALGRKDIGYKEDGFASLTAITNGFFVRNNPDKNITTSFQDFMKSYNAVWQLGYGIEKIGFKEIVRIEHVSHFYQNIVTMKLGGAPSDITRKCATDYFYSSIEVGYSKPSGASLYEEAQGLDEYNIKNNYTTAITKVDKKLINESNYRADSYGIEFARRKPYVKFPDQDTRYDLDVMMLDLKKGITNVFNLRKWSDDFVVPEPFNKSTTGVYSPETAYNLRLSPLNTLLRMGFWIKGCLMKNLTEYVRYTSTHGNNLLKTKSIKEGSIEYSENGNILNSDLDKNLFNPDIITFKYPVSNTLLKQVTGKTLVNGEWIMNYYGLVEFINEDGNYEYGFLLSLEPNKDGSWELLSSTRRINSFNHNTNANKNITDPYDLTASTHIL